MELPIIDFAKCSIKRNEISQEDINSIGDEIYETLSEVGFVYLENTGISEEEFSSIRSLFKEFYDLDNETKTKYAIDKSLFGYTAAGIESADPTKPNFKELKEVFDVNGMGLKSDTSKWPDDELPHFQPTVRIFMEKLRILSINILDALSVGMKMKDPTYYSKCHTRSNDVRNITKLRSLYYPAVPNEYEIKEGEMRLNEHADFGTFGLIFQDDVGGLEVKTKEGVYIDAPPIPGTALLNIGNCLSFMTNGRLTPTVHRVLMPDPKVAENRDRSSLAYLFVPNHEVVLADPDARRSPNEEEPMTVFEYMVKK